MAQQLEENKISQTGQIVVFSLAGKEYGLPVEYVTSIEKVTAITRVPNVKRYIKGVINLRGIIVPVLDLRTRFGFTESPFTEQTRILIISIAGIIAGLIVDAATDLLHITDADIEEQPDVIGVEKQDFIHGVVYLQDRLIMLLDLQHILELAGVAENEE